MTNPIEELIGKIKDEMAALSLKAQECSGEDVFLELVKSHGNVGSIIRDFFKNKLVLEEVDEETVKSTRDAVLAHWAPGTYDPQNEVGFMVVNWDKNNEVWVCAEDCEIWFELPPSKIFNLPDAVEGER